MPRVSRGHVGDASPSAPHHVAAIGAAESPARPTIEQLFAGPRPASMRRGLEPAFLLFDRPLLDQLHATADQLGIRTDALVQRIARDHVDEY